MSLIIASQDVQNKSHSPASFNNIISNSFKLKPFSKVALKSALLNVSPERIITSQNDTYGLYFGQKLPDDDLFYTDDTDEQVPEEKIKLTANYPAYCRLPQGAYNSQELIAELNDTSNEFITNQSFRNALVFSELKNNTSEVIGMKATTDQKTLPSQISPANSTNPIHVYDAGKGAINYSSGAFTALQNNVWAGCETQKPIFSANGTISITTPSTDNTPFIIGLSRNTNRNRFPRFFQPSLSIDSLPFDNWDDTGLIDSGWWDYCLYFDGSTLKLYNLKYSRTSRNYFMPEVQYYNSAQYGGTSDYSSVITDQDMGSVEIVFKIENEMVSIDFDNSNLSSDQLKCANTNCDSLYGKIYLYAQDYTKDSLVFNKGNYNTDWVKSLIKDEDNLQFEVKGYDSWTNNILDFYTDPLFPYHVKDLKEADYWAGTYSGIIANKIFSMTKTTDEIPAGLWITDYNKAISSSSYLTYSDKQNFIYLFGNDRYFLNTNFSLPVDEIYMFEDATITAGKAETEMVFNTLRSMENVYLRVKNFGNNNSINGGTTSVSKIISEIDLVNDAEGLTLYEPAERVYLELNNSEEILIDSIDCDIVDLKERVVEFLEDGTVIILHVEHYIKI